MYAGDIADGAALHNLVLGTATLAVAQLRTHPSFRISVILRPDSAATVAFAGSGQTSEDDLAVLAAARLEAATSVATGISLDALDIEGGVFCDLCVVNALSDWMCDQSWSGASIHAHMFRDGAFESRIQAPVIADGGPFGEQGWSTTFLPSGRIFPSIVFDADRLQAALDLLCRKSAGAEVTLVDAR
jgi:DNA gyrase/topoisomerase IV subunit B